MFVREVFMPRSRQRWWLGDQGRKRHEVLVHDLCNGPEGTHEKAELLYRFGVSKPAIRSYMLLRPTKMERHEKQMYQDGFARQKASGTCPRPKSHSETTACQPARRLLQEELMPESPRKLQLLGSFWRVMANLTWVNRYVCCFESNRRIQDAV